MKDVRLPRSVRPALRTDLQVVSQNRTATGRRIILVDLNNFASFPTLAIGILVASLRNAGHDVSVICPLAHDAPAVQRERQETLLDHLKRRVHLSSIVPFQRTRDRLRRLHDWKTQRPHPVVLREVSRALEGGADAVLLSAYLQHYNSVAKIAEIAQAAGVPVLLGGPMFNVNEVADAWSDLPGISGIVGAEVDRDLPEILETLCTGGDLTRHRGMTVYASPRSTSAPPLRSLDDTPLPDFTDFPWDRYSVRIVPLMTGRGCQWDKCTFCSDVVSVSGRTFRTRSVDNVLIEMQEQSRRHDTSSFLFLDLKLNSHPGMIRGIAKGLRTRVHGAEWVGTVHVDLRRDNGLSAADLQAAVAGGMRRISFGLESGSQPLLDRMQKGTSVARNSQFITEAYAAGLSIRCTMFSGYPGETAQDMEATAQFLEAHGQYLDRIRFNAFSLQNDTPIFQMVMEKGGNLEDLSVRRTVDRIGRADYWKRTGQDRAYRRAKARALRAVYDINRQSLRPAARQFDGLM